MHSLVDLRLPQSSSQEVLSPGLYLSLPGLRGVVLFFWKRKRPQTKLDPIYEFIGLEEKVPPKRELIKGCEDHSLHSHQVPGDLPDQCPLWRGSFSFIRQSTSCIFIRLFIWTDLQIIRNPFIRPWTWFKGNTGKNQFCMMSLWVPCFRKPCSTLCSRLLLLNRSIFFSVFLPHTPHTPNRHKTVRAQGHRFVLINVCSVLNCCPLILNSEPPPASSPQHCLDLGERGTGRNFRSLAEH